MLLSSAIRQLGMIDCTVLRERVLGIDAQLWQSDTTRQRAFDVHAQTQSIVLLFCTGWPAIRVSRHAGWGQLHEPCMPLVHEIIADHYEPGGVVLRCMVVRLPAGGRIALHRDVHPSFAIAHRIHVPLVTNPDVELTIGNESIATREQCAFELNNFLPHRVTNRGAEARIHLIFDYAAPRH